MRLRPLGWELACFLIVFGTLVAGILANWFPLIFVSLGAAAVATPLVLISLGARLIAGILDEDHRVRRSRTPSRS
jgi:hypothetical protein